MVHSLLAPASPETTPSLGYYSDSDNSEKESEGLEMVEDYAALEDEGVTGMSRGKYAIREVRVGVRCLKILSLFEDSGTSIVL